MSSKAMLQLQFSPDAILKLAGRYGSTNDHAALAAGSQMRKGRFAREHLAAIFEWKTQGRGPADCAAEIEDALRLAVSAQTERAGISVLAGLEGVAVPVASAILTAIDPRRYTVIDFRALEALGAKRAASSYTVDFCLRYLQACRDLARRHQVSLRDLDRALWQWSSERPNRP